MRISGVASSGPGASEDAKQSVRVASTAAVTLATAFENGDTIDGVVLATGDRILIKDQAAGATNGIYTVNASGAPTRADDADTSAKLTAGMLVYVSEGTANGNSVWALTTDDAITLDTTALVFAEVAGSQIALLDQAQTFTAARTFSGDVVLSQNGGKDTLALSDTTADVGITIGADTNLYRSAANILKTDDALTVTGATILSSTLAVTGTSALTGVVTATGGVVGVSTNTYKPTAAAFETWPRSAGFTGSSQSLAPSATVTMYAIELPAGVTVSNISVMSGTVAAIAPTVQFFGLYTTSSTNSTVSRLATSADDGSTAWGANTLKTLAMTTPYAVVTSGLYYVAVLVTAATVPDFIAATSVAHAATVTLAPRASGFYDTAQSSLPATATYSSANSLVAYAYTS